MVRLCYKALNIERSHLFDNNRTKDGEKNEAVWKLTFCRPLKFSCFLIKI